MSTGQEIGKAKLYAIACHVHGVTRYLAKGRGFFTTDLTEVEHFNSKESARRVAREQAYSCTVEPAP